MNKTIIKTKRLVLKSLTLKNATAEYCSWLNDPQVNRFISIKKVSLESIRNYIKEKNKRASCLFLGIFWKRNNEHIGNVKLEPIDLKKGRATTGILIGNKNYWGKGIATETLKALCQYAFQELNLQEINLGVDFRNKPAQRVYQKVGFAATGKKGRKIFMTKKKEKQILIVGLGSIGQRHLANLQSLGIKNFVLVDKDKAKLKKFGQEPKIKIFSSLKSALKERINAGLICTPPNSHLKIAQDLVNRGVEYLFIEKPLSNGLAGVNQFIKKVKKQKTKVLVGYNFRFEPGLNLVKKLLKQKKIGKLLFVRAEGSYYLPSWQPGRDYRKSYTAKKKMGGGIILDGSHEIDYALWLAGKSEPNKLVSLAGKLSELEVEAEDTAEILLGFKSGLIMSLHQDFIQRNYSRSCKLVGSQGTIIWDFAQNQVKLFQAKTKKWQTFKIKPNSNQMYLEEMKHFLQVIEGKAKPLVTLDQGREVLKFALLAKQSAQTNKQIFLDRASKV